MQTTCQKIIKYIYYNHYYYHTSTFRIIKDHRNRKSFVVVGRLCTGEKRFVCVCAHKVDVLFVSKYINFLNIDFMKEGSEGGRERERERERC